MPSKSHAVRDAALGSTTTYCSEQLALNSSLVASVKLTTTERAGAFRSSGRLHRGQAHPDTEASGALSPAHTQTFHDAHFRRKLS
jgi:hypothetical protein